MNVNSSKICKRGQSFWADLGTDNRGSEQNGFRPVVIIQNNVGNKFSPTVIVAIISSQINKAKLPTHVILKKSEFSWLEKDSFIALEQVKTIDKSRLKDFIGEINEDKFNDAIEVSLGLKTPSSNNYYYRTATQKLEEVEELRACINVLTDKNKNIKVIEEITNEYNIKTKEFLNFINKFNVEIKYPSFELTKKIDKRMVV